jgi:proliferating cell nuclear antigen
MPTLIRKYSHSDEPNYDDYFKKDYVGCKTQNSEYIKNIIVFISTIVSQLNIYFNEDGIEIKAMDIGHISLIHCFIPKNMFELYNCDKQYVIGIDLTTLVQVLNQLKPDDELIFVFGKNNHLQDKIEIIFLNKRYEKFYEFKLIDIEGEDYDIHEFEDVTEIETSSKYINNIIKDFEDIGENLRVKILKEKEKISLKTDGDMTNLKMILNNSELEFKNLKDICLEFNLKHIGVFTKGFNLSSKINIQIDNNVPIKLNYKIGDGFLNYYLAPKIEDD